MAKQVKKINYSLRVFLKLLKSLNGEMRKLLKTSTTSSSKVVSGQKRINKVIKQNTQATNNFNKALRTSARLNQKSQLGKSLGPGGQQSMTAGGPQFAKFSQNLRLKNRLLKQGTSALKAIKGATLAYLGVLGVQKLLQFAEAAQATTNRLKVARRPGEDIAKSFKKIAAIALETRQPLVELATMYSRITLATKGMNVTQKQAFKITKNFGKLLTIQGTSAHEARSALTQFTQALQSGKLAGDEFRSISENLPPILDHLAKATGKPRDQLKQLAEQGKLSTDLLLRAMLMASDQIDKDFAKTGVTVAQAGNVINTTITIMVKKFMDSKNGGKALMAIFKGLIVVLQGLGAILNVVFSAISVLIDAVRILVDLFGGLLEVIGDVIESGFGLNKLFGGLGGEKTAAEIDAQTKALGAFAVVKKDLEGDMFGALGGASPEAQAEEKMSAEEAKGANIKTLTPAVIKRNMQDLIQSFQEFKQGFQDSIFNSITKDMAGGIGDAFADMVVAGKSFSESMKSVFKNMAKTVIAQIVKMIVQMLIMKGIMAMLGLGAVSAATSTAGGDTGSNPFGAILGGGKGFKAGFKGLGFAGGGNVTAGGPYVVGEEGPELFTPSSSGNITPNGEMGGAMGGGVIIQNLSIMPNSSIDQALMDKPPSYWLEIAQEKILPALNTLGQGGETTNLEFRGAR